MTRSLSTIQAALLKAISNKVEYHFEAKQRASGMGWHAFAREKGMLFWYRQYLASLKELNREWSGSDDEYLAKVRTLIHQTGEDVDYPSPHQARSDTKELIEHLADKG